MLPYFRRFSCGNINSDEYVSQNDRYFCLLKKDLTVLQQNQITRFIVVITLLALGGCSTTGVIPMDQDSYLIGKTGGGMPGFGNSPSNKAEIYQQANDFCKAKGLEVKTIKLMETPAAIAKLRTIELQFRCVSPGGTATPLIKESDQVIEIRQR